MTKNISYIALSSKSGIIFFGLGKVLRFAFFIVFLLLLGSRTRSIGGYNLWQMIFFFLTFNLVDIASQFFLREVYRFRTYVVTGQFDYILSKPFSPLLRSLFGGSDIIDLFTLVPLILFIIYAMTKVGIISVIGVLLYVFLVLNALVIALAFHVFVLGVGVITTEVDNAIWIFRDLTQLGRIPVDIYRQPISFLLTFILPVGIMLTFPAKALFGLLAPSAIVYATGFSLFLLFLSVCFWGYALNNYASASS